LRPNPRTFVIYLPASVFADEMQPRTPKRLIGRKSDRRTESDCRQDVAQNSLTSLVCSSMRNRVKGKSFQLPSRRPFANLLGSRTQSMRSLSWVTKQIADVCGVRLVEPLLAARKADIWASELLGRIKERKNHSGGRAVLTCINHDTQMKLGTCGFLRVNRFYRKFLTSIRFDSAN